MRYISPLPGTSWKKRWPRSLVILGSTGSIGTSALNVLRAQPGRFQVLALAAGRNIPLLARQAAEFRPNCLGILEENDIPALRSLLPAAYSPRIVSGQRGYEELARLSEACIVLSAQVGAAGLRATLAAAQAGKVIALANKESLVLAGNLIRKICWQQQATILPVDSEHNALFQCLTEAFSKSYQPHINNNSTTSSSKEAACGRLVSRLVLTASGGPLYTKTREELAAISPEQALAHPNWSMGAKISIDSATMMNKGLEIIEACHLYGLPLSAIDVLVHRESVVHSLVEYADGSFLAQLCPPDMRIPLAHCLGWPERLPGGSPRLDLAALGALHFARPDTARFPCLALARQAQEHGFGSPVVLNAANEVAVAAFLAGRANYLAIAEIVEQCLEDHASGAFLEHDACSEPESIETILALDAETRLRAQALLGAGKNDAAQERVGRFHNHVTGLDL